MKRLYLIRHNVYTFKGPMTLEEVKKYSKSAQSNAEDEISGNCSKWIQLGDYGRLRKYYPEVSKVIAKDNGDWGVSLASVEPVKIAFAKSVFSKKVIGWSAGAICIFLATVYYFSENGAVATGVLFSSKKPTPKTAHELLVSNNYDDLAVFIKRNLPYIIKEVNKNPKLLPTWLPYLRAHAFNADGEMEKMPQKVLNGNASIPGVADCRYLAWIQIWRKQTGALEGFIQAQSVGNTEFERLLAWDPAWIARRRPIGWMKPANLYEGCFHLGTRAMQKVLPNNAPIYAALMARLSYMKDSLSGKRVAFAYDNVTQLNLLDLFNCYEQAQSEANIATCDSFQIDNPKVVDVITFKRAVSMLRIKQSDPAAIQAILAELPLIAPLYQFDYQPEIFYWQQRANQMSHQDAAKIAQEKYPEVVFD